MTVAATDPVLRRFERTAAAVAACSTLAALAVRGGNPDMAAGVVAGAALVGVSYWAIKGGISGLTGHALDRRARWRAVLRLVGRYALLSLFAYVMIARLRMQPIGLLIGASSAVAAAAIEAVRMLSGWPPSTAR